MRTREPIPSGKQRQSIDAGTSGDAVSAMRADGMESNRLVATQRKVTDMIAQGPAATAHRAFVANVNVSQRVVRQSKAIDNWFGSASGPATAMRTVPPVQRTIINDTGRSLNFDEVKRAVDTDPSAQMNSSAAANKLREMIGENVVYSIAEILDALGGGPKNVKRKEGEGDITLLPPGSNNTVSLATIAGTHRSIATTFTDGRSVEDMTRSLVADPTLVTRTQNFILTVFNSTAPGQATGAGKLWSMNNRRLKAMQDADAQLKAAGKPGLPDIQITWADKRDMEHAVRDGAFNNEAHAGVGFHTTQTRIARLSSASAIRPPSGEIDEKAIEALLKSGNIDAINEYFNI